MNNDAARVLPELAPSDTPYARGLALVAELSQALAASNDIESTLQLAVQQIIDLMEIDAASIFLLDAAGEHLVCRACAGPVDVRGITIAKDAGVVGRTFSHAQTQWVRDASSDPDFLRAYDSNTGFVTRSMLSAPLLTARGALGVIQIINKQDGSLFDSDDLNLLRVLAAPVALSIAHAAFAQEQVERSRIRRELELARRMQKSLLPKRRRGHFPLLAVNRPAREISGDFYDYFELVDGRIGFTIGDVSGKGLDAALLMVRGASLMRWIGKEGLAPEVWLAKVNEELCESVSHGMFLCAVAGWFDPGTRQAHWANAGFPPALLHQANQFQSFPALNPPLGILDTLTFESQHTTIGDGSFYLYSDGATDVLDFKGERLGVAGVQALIEAHQHAAPEARLRGMLSLLRQRRLADDTTLMLIEARA